MPVCRWFAGGEVVDWLYQRVEGFSERREARKYAAQLLKAGLIKHTVNKRDFSEQCYYVFGDICDSKCYYVLSVIVSATMSSGTSVIVAKCYYVFGDICDSKC